MAFIVGELAVSWLLLWLYERSHLSALGFKPTLLRIQDLTFGVLSAAVVAGAGHYMIAVASGSHLSVNANYTILEFLSGTWWMSRSVAIEELMFRGALLYIMIKLIGINKSCLLSAVAFGVYHWFSYGVFGNVAQMIYVFLITGVGGMMFAYAFSFTRSLYLPFGLHFGWNMVSTVIFSQGPLGTQFLVVEGGSQLGVGWSIANLLYQVSVLPSLTFLYLKRRSLVGREIPTSR
jgi:hypothetical protein